MSFKVKRRDVDGFRSWLGKLGYNEKSLPDGGYTFKGKGSKPRNGLDLDYVFLDKNLSGSASCRVLYAEYRHYTKS